MSKDRKQIVIVGATSGIAEACARIWAGKGGHDFVLFGRNRKALDAIAADLTVRDPGTQVKCVTGDLVNATKVDTLLEERPQGPLHTALVAIGELPDQELMQQSTLALADSVTVNAVAPVLWTEALVRLSSKQTRIGVIGSVAGDRGRKSNYSYGAAKGMIERYVQGLQHRFAVNGPTLVLIKPGPTRTVMTAHLDQEKMAKVEDVAHDIVTGLSNKRATIYTPRKWAMIMTVIRNLPKFVFNRMDI